MDELIDRLMRYSEKAIADALDPDFAKAVTQVRSELYNCKNELCYKCGEYKTAHLGSCDGCRWKE